MSSKSSKRAETALTTLDAAAKGFTVAVPIAKPALKALNKYTPQNSLKRGDRAQASTLDILEDTAEIMEPYQHNILQKGFDQYVVSSAYFSSLLTRPRQTPRYEERPGRSRTHRGFDEMEQVS